MARDRGGRVTVQRLDDQSKSVPCDWGCAMVSLISVTGPGMPDLRTEGTKCDFRGSWKQGEDAPQFRAAICTYGKELLEI